MATEYMTIFSSNSWQSWVYKHILKFTKIDGNFDTMELN